MQLLLIWSLLVSTFVDAKLFGARTGVPELSAKNFRDEVLYNGNVTAVVFYAPWCGYCQQLSSEWKKTAKNLRGIARVVAVDCDADVNKPLCAKYNVQGFPTIKVFQPAKLTDVDLKNAVVDGKPLPRRRPKVYSYTGARESEPITKYIVSHLRNYVATLESDESLKWLATNKIPRVVMLPGKRYKSRQVSPLLKTLSREYFGKIRFATIPRRVDGAWNLLNMKAPDDSQLVYMSDDRPAVVYKGSMKKKAIKQFLDEQYELEMNRRRHSKGDASPERDSAANGLEFVVEDQQTEELEHIKRMREQRIEHEEAAKEARRAAFSRYGVEPTEIEDETESSQETATPTTTAPGSEESAADEGEEAEDFEFTETDVVGGGSAGVDDDADDTGDNADGNTDDSTDEQPDDVLLDSTVVELTPDQIVQEGPEAIRSYLAKYHTDEESTQTASSSAAAPGPTARREFGLKKYDDFVMRCMRTGYNCALLLTTTDYKDEDLTVLVRGLEKAPMKLRRQTVFEYAAEDADADLQDFLQSVGVTQRPTLFWWDVRRQKLAVHRGGWSSDQVDKFLTGAFKRTLPIDIELPKKYLYWIAEAEVEELAKQKTATKRVKDEL